jgi:hypothetical protein
MKQGVKDATLLEDDPSRIAVHGSDLGDHLGAAMAHVLHDLEVSGAPVPRIEESDWQPSPGAESGMLWAADGSGTSVWVDTGVSEAEQIAMLADQVQEWVVEQAWLGGIGHTNWPQCPEHPHNHPLAAVVKAGTATWTCRRSGRAVSDIGRLAPPG